MLQNVFIHSQQIETITVWKASHASLAAAGAQRGRREFFQSSRVFVPASGKKYQNMNSAREGTFDSAKTAFSLLIKEISKKLVSAAKQVAKARLTQRVSAQIWIETLLKVGDFLRALKSQISLRQRATETALIKS